MVATTLEPPTQALLGDGTPFHLGMTVFLPVGGVDADGPIRRIDTDAGEHEIDSFVYEGRTYNCLNRKGCKSGTDLGFFFGSRESVLDARIAMVRQEIAERYATLASLRAERKLGS